MLRRESEAHTVVYAAWDEEHNEALVVKELLEGRRWILVAGRLPQFALNIEREDGP